MLPHNSENVLTFCLGRVIIKQNAKQNLAHFFFYAILKNKQNKTTMDMNSLQWQFTSLRPVSWTPFRCLRTPVYMYCIYVHKTHCSANRTIASRTPLLLQRKQEAKNRIEKIKVRVENKNSVILHAYIVVLVCANATEYKVLKIITKKKQIRL